MILNVNKREINIILNLLELHPSSMDDNLKEKLKRLLTTSEPVKSTIEQVRTAE